MRQTSARIGSFALLVVLTGLLATCNEQSVPPEPAPVLGSIESEFQAGVAVVDITPPVGLPLAGFGGDSRRLPIPDFDPSNDYTFFRPSDGTLDPLYAKALVLFDGTTKVAIVSLDLIAVAGESVEVLHQKAVALGSTIPLENLMVTASHTHAGPGTLTTLHFWELIGMDLFVPSRFNQVLQKCAEALVAAEANLEPARLGWASDHLTGVTENRRSEDSPYLTDDMIDDELGVLRVDRSDGAPLAVLWNFAIHGTAYRPSNLKYSADIMGVVSAKIESELGVPALFVNGAEGDIKPMHSGEWGIEQLAPVMSARVLQVYEGVETTADITLGNSSDIVSFGEATLDLSLERLEGSTFPLPISPYVGNPGMVVPLDESWFANKFRFQAIRINNLVLVSVPGEPLHQVGLAIKNDGKSLGFDGVFLFGLANGHMAYITSEQEYAVGAYEGIATFFGPQTAANVREACLQRMSQLQP